MSSTIRSSRHLCPHPILSTLGTSTLYIRFRMFIENWNVCSYMLRVVRGM
jgi:hypothetical protein